MCLAFHMRVLTEKPVSRINVTILVNSSVRRNLVRIGKN